MSANIKVIENDCKLNKILNREYLAKRSHYIEVGPDKTILPGKFLKFSDRIQNFEVRDDDVFILAFPKTGSRWTQEMVWLLLNNLNFEKARDISLDVRSPLFEYEILFDDVKNEVFYFDQTLKLASPRCIKTHLPWSLLPKAINTGAKQIKIIVVLRGPEDTCTSFYHQAKVVGGYTGSWGDYCDLFLGGKVPNGPFWKHVLGMWEQKCRSNILFIKYNKMKADLAETIREVATFLGKNVSDDDIVKMCDHLSFDNLKKSPAFNKETYLMTMQGVVNPFLRKGQVGDHKNAMTPEVIEAFKNQREEYLTGTGLTFD